MKNKKSKKILLILIIIAIFIIGIFLGKTIFKNQENIKQNSETTTQIVEKQVSTQTIENTLQPISGIFGK